MITTTEELLAKLVSASKCGKCKGTGLPGPRARARKTCLECRGSGVADLNHPRIRFNGGFHDATLESLAGRVREVRATDAGGWFYAAGYAAGLAAVKDGAPRPTTSELAWSVFVAPIVTLPAYARAMGEWL